MSPFTSTLLGWNPGDGEWEDGACHYITYIYIYIYTHTHNTHTYNQVEERIISITSEDSGYSFIFLQGFKLILGSVSHRPDLFPS